MKKSVRTVIAVLSLAVAHQAHADPVPITAASPGATTYSFFLIKTKKLGKATLEQAKTGLETALAPYGVTPCIVAADRNASIVCGTPSTPAFMLAVPGEFFSYDFDWNLKDLPPINDRREFNKDRAYDQVWAANFRSPEGTVPGDTAGRVPVHVQFAQPVTEFSFLVDSANPLAPASGSIQLIVNGIALEPQALVPGVPTVVGVQDVAGFTELTIVAAGGQSQAFLADRFAFVPMR